MKKPLLAAFLVAFVGLSAWAQEVRVPYQLNLGVGYVTSFSDLVGFENEDGSFYADADTTGSGNTRISADANVNMGRRRRFGLGLSYRRYAPDNGYSVSGIGPFLSWTRPISNRAVSRLSFAAGRGSYDLDGAGIDETVFGDVTYSSMRGGFFEAEWQFAFPVFELSRADDGRTVNLAPHIGFAFGGFLVTESVEFAEAALAPTGDDTYYFGIDVIYTTVFVGASLVPILGN